MIKIVWSIKDINKYQTGNLPDNAIKIETPKSVDELMKKALPIAVILCVLLFAAMLGKTIVCKVVVISPIFILVGFALGFLLLIIHEWLHGIVYPKDADVTIGRIKGKTTFVALASYPLKRDRFILMCLLPFVLGVIPFILFLISPAEYDDDEDAMYECVCPNCGDTIMLGENIIADGSIDCPNCGESLEFDFSEIEDEDNED